MARKPVWLRLWRRVKACSCKGRFRGSLIYQFFTSKAEDYETLKGLLGFPFGMLLGAGLYAAVIVRMRLPEFLRYALGGFFIMGLGAGYATSIQVRCISLLLLPTFFGKSGRSYITSFAISFLLAGPIANIMLNAKEVHRMLTCNAELAENMSHKQFELRMKPIHDIMLSMMVGWEIGWVQGRGHFFFILPFYVVCLKGIYMVVSDSLSNVVVWLLIFAHKDEHAELQDLNKEGKTMHNTTIKLQGAFNPLQQEVEDEGEVEQMKKDTDYVDGVEEHGQSRTGQIDEKYKTGGGSQEDAKERQYERKMDYRCEDIYSQGVIQCRKMFEATHKKCMNKMKFAGHLICLPVKLTVLCKLAKYLPQMTGINCNSMEAVNEGFGDGYGTAQKASQEMDTGFKVNMQYKVIKADEVLDVTTAEDVSKSVSYEFEQRKAWLDFIMTMISRFMAFIFIKVFMSANSYNKKYTTKFQFDNIYLTSYFRRIDARRRIQSKSTLLPLKKLESKGYTTPLSTKLMSSEKSKLVSGTVRLMLRLFTYGMMIFIDRLIFETMDIIRKKTYIEFKQTGSHHISLVVYGQGIMGKMLGSMLKGFNAKHAINYMASNIACLPHAKKMPNEYIRNILLITLATWCLMLVEAYGLRLRRVIASFFYPKREKKRILFLYNDLLKKRKGFLKHVRHEAKRKARENKLNVKLSYLASLRQQFPRLCVWMSWLKIGRRKCLICDEVERKDFQTCPTKGCNFGYCTECWIDIKRNCYACRDDEDWDAESEVTDIEWDN